MYTALEKLVANAKEELSLAKEHLGTVQECLPKDIDRVGKDTQPDAFPWLDRAELAGWGLPGCGSMGFTLSNLSLLVAPKAAKEGLSGNGLRYPSFQVEGRRWGLNIARSTSLSTHSTL